MLLAFTPWDKRHQRQRPNQASAIGRAEQQNGDPSSTQLVILAFAARLDDLLAFLDRGLDHHHLLRRLRTTRVQGWRRRRRRHGRTNDGWYVQVRT